jgi:hypothetical protein
MTLLAMAPGAKRHNAKLGTAADQNNYRLSQNSFEILDLQNGADAKHRETEEQLISG